MAIRIRVISSHVMCVRINKTIIDIWNKYDWFNVRTELGWP